MSSRYLNVQRIEDSKKLCELLEGMVDVTNHVSFSPEASGKIMAEKLYNTHRTLQQSFIHVISEMISAYGNLCGQYGDDLRNEQAHKWAVKVAEVTDQHHFSVI